MAVWGMGVHLIALMVDHTKEKLLWLRTLLKANRPMPEVRALREGQLLN